MLSGDIEIAFLLEMGIVLLWSKFLFFLLALWATHGQKWDRILVSKDRLIHDYKTYETWYESGFL